MLLLPISSFQFFANGSSVYKLELSAGVGLREDGRCRVYWVDHGRVNLPSDAMSDA